MYLLQVAVRYLSNVICLDQVYSAQADFVLDLNIF